MKEYQKFLLMLAVFLIAYFLPVLNPDVQKAILESFILLNDYAQKHVLFCLVPAFFIAGAIGVFISQASVMKYLGAKAKKWLAYGVASVSGAILAVCSCTVLPLFAGIHKRGAGLGPAITFLYSGPAINVMAIILTARVLGLEMGIARAVGAVFFSIVIGLLMQLIFGKEEELRQEGFASMPAPEEKRSLWQYVIYFFSMVGIMVFASWSKPAVSSADVSGNSFLKLWTSIYNIHWYIVLFFAVILAMALYLWFTKDEMKEWVSQTWSFTKQIMPLLFAGVMIAGFLLGRPDTDSGIIPSQWIAQLVGGNSLWANLFASVSGALMYFATLTEVPILQGLMGAGMGKGPALALLLAGPALSLPNMLVIRSVMGTKKTLVYISLVVVMSTAAGMIYGNLF
ncbi:MAG: permease [Candidatus Eremiobacteraeota bacterium]|nr:permease [Candidatus Eremiobacteraeota bacterium]